LGRVLAWHNWFDLKQKYALLKKTVHFMNIQADYQGARSKDFFEKQAQNF
jgi:hypothetical protein